jgi:hypothetical protein
MDGCHARTPADGPDTLGTGLLTIFGSIRMVKSIAGASLAYVNMP